MLFLDQVSSKDVQSINKSLETIKTEVYTPDISDLLYCYIIFGLILIVILWLIYRRKRIKGFSKIIQSILEIFIIPTTISILLEPTLIERNTLLVFISAIMLIGGLAIIVAIYTAENDIQQIDSVIFLPGEEYEVFSDNCEIVSNTTNTKISAIDEYVIIGGQIKNLNVKNIKLIGEKGEVEIKPERKLKIYRYKTEELINYCKEKSISPIFKIVIETE